jgi:hypothetical protein
LYPPDVIVVPPVALNVFGVTELLALDEDELPFALFAVIVNVYAVNPAKLPVTVNGDVVPEEEREIEGLEVTV